MTIEKPEQDVNMPKKPVLGSYYSQVVQSKSNSFRKPQHIRGEFCNAETFNCYF